MEFNIYPSSLANPIVISHYYNVHANLGYLGKLVLLYGYCIAFVHQNHLSKVEYVVIKGEI